MLHALLGFQALPSSGEKSSSVLDCPRPRDGAPLPAYDALNDVSRGCKFGERVIGLYPRRSWLFIAPMSLLDICTASLRISSWACLGAWLLFLTKPRWQVIQSRLSMPRRCRELSKICAPRPISRRRRRVRGRFPNCLLWDRVLGRIGICWQPLACSAQHSAPERRCVRVEAPMCRCAFRTAGSTTFRLGRQVLGARRQKASALSFGPEHRG